MRRDVRPFVLRLTINGVKLEAIHKGMSSRRWLTTLSLLLMRRLSSAVPRLHARDRKLKLDLWPNRFSKGAQLIPSLFFPLPHGGRINQKCFTSRRKLRSLVLCRSLAATSSASHQNIINDHRNCATFERNFMFDLLLKFKDSRLLLLALNDLKWQTFEQLSKIFSTLANSAN